MSLIEGENARYCLQCNDLKHFDNFSPDKSGKYGYLSHCKPCRNRKVRNKTEIDRLINIEIEWVDGELFMESFNAKVCTKCDELKPNNEYHKNNKQSDGLACRCKSCILKSAKKYGENNREKLRKRSRKYYEENKEKELRRTKKFYRNNKEMYDKWRKQWRKENPNYDKEYQRKRYNNDIQFKLRKIYHHSFSKFVKGKQSKKISKIIGCSWENFRKYIEKQFEAGMTWDNHNFEGWHIDHIIPASFFDHTCEYQRGICWHYSNFQPLWADENMSKQDKIPNLIYNINKNYIKNYATNNYKRFTNFRRTS